MSAGRKADYLERLHNEQGPGDPSSVFVGDDVRLRTNSGARIALPVLSYNRVSFVSVHIESFLAGCCCVAVGSLTVAVVAPRDGSRELNHVTVRVCRATRSTLVSSFATAAELLRRVVCLCGVVMLSSRGGRGTSK